VIDVDDADGYEDQPAAEVEAAREQRIQIGLLDLDFPSVIGRRDGVLDFELGVEAQLLGEVVPDVQNQAAQIDDGLPG
jgi:hypothetical protein